MREKTKKILKSKKGITLIALVVTIVVLLILAGVSISMLGGENGIITQAIEAKEETTIGEEKENVQLAATAAKTKTNWGEITEENLAEELTKNIGTRDEDYTLTKDGDKFTLTITDSNRSYEIDANGNVTTAQTKIYFSFYSKFNTFRETLYAYSGQTWNEWVESGLAGEQGADFYDGGNGLFGHDNTGTPDVGVYYDTDWNQHVRGTDLIQEGGIYYAY